MITMNRPDHIFTRVIQENNLSEFQTMRFDYDEITIYMNIANFNPLY